MVGFIALFNNQSCLALRAYWYPGLAWPSGKWGYPSSGQRSWKRPPRSGRTKSLANRGMSSPNGAGLGLGHGIGVLVAFNLIIMSYPNYLTYLYIWQVTGETLSLSLLGIFAETFSEDKVKPIWDTSQALIRDAHIRLQDASLRGPHQPAKSLKSRKKIGTTGIPRL